MRGLTVLVMLTAAAGGAAGVYFLPEFDELGTAGGLGALAVIEQPAPAAATPEERRGPSAQTPLYGSPTDASRDRKSPTAGRVSEPAPGARAPLMKPTGNVEEPQFRTREDATRNAASELQKELTRVGCYTGEITGEWDAASRRAMRTFLERVNAKLPVQQPDHVLLAFVRGQGSGACGAACPAGQVANGTGECVPQTLATKAPPRPTSRIAVSTVDAAQSPAGNAGPIATGPAVTGSRPVPPATRTPDKVAQASSWTTEVAPAASDVKPVPRVAADRSALAGRMTLGAAAPQPVEIAPVVPKSAARLPDTGRTGVKRVKSAAVPADTPSAAASEDTTTPVGSGRLPTDLDDASVAARPEPEARPPAIDRPGVAPGPARRSTQQRALPPTASAPASRSGSRRDWKAAVFDQSSR